MTSWSPITIASNISCGVCGKAGNIKGQIQPGGNPFEAPRAREYPNPPMKETYFGALFRKGAERLGYHPYPQPSANMSRPYSNPEGLDLQQCVFCGFCERYACEHFAKASPQTVILPVLLKSPNYELRTNCEVLRINLDSDRQEGNGRHLYGRLGCRIRAASRTRAHHGLPAQQRSHAAALRDRQAL